MAGVQIDGVNNKIDFDDDLDTSISANTDDTLVIEAGGNTMATITATTFTINDGTTITTADNTDNLTLKSTDTDADIGPNLRLYRAVAGAASDAIGTIDWAAQDAGGGLTDYASAAVTITDATDGNEDATLTLKVMNAGSLNQMLTISGPETVVNEGSKDHDFRVESNGNANMLFVDGGNDSIGIGTSSPSSYNSSADDLVIANTGHSGITIASGTSSSGGIFFADGTSGDTQYRGTIQYNHTNDFMVFGTTGGTERMRIASDGDILLNAGNIDSSTDDLKIYSTDSNHCGIRFASSAAVPITNTGGTSDGAMSFGSGSYRWATIFASTGSINTSDKNEKQDIEELTDAEKKVAVVAKGLLRKYKFKDAVEKKGDKARTHFGVIAQDLEDAFKAEGLDANKYGMFCSDTWWETQTEVAAVEAVEEVTDEEGNVTTEAVEAKDAYTRTDAFETLEEAPEGATERTRLGVRYSELLAFIIIAI